MQVELTEGVFVDATLEAVAAAAGYVAMHWGEYGYRVERIARGTTSGGIRLGICALDGSRFTVEATRNGHAHEVLVVPGTGVAA